MGKQESELSILLLSHNNIALRAGVGEIEMRRGRSTSMCRGRCKILPSILHSIGRSKVLLI